MGGIQRARNKDMQGNQKNMQRPWGESIWEYLRSLNNMKGLKHCKPGVEGGDEAEQDGESRAMNLECI